MSGEAVERARRALGRDPWNAFVSTRFDEETDAGGGPLAGVTLSVKDNLAVAGMRMTCGSRFLADYVAPYDATVVGRARRAGAVVVGKTNMDEFACGSSGESSAFGPTRNPADTARVPGGSSSGAGASVAAGVVDVALGSDTGGSVRAPGSFCGVAALKPSPGALPRHGLADLAMSLESPAPMAKTVDLVRKLLLATAGPDPHDPATQRFAFAPDDGKPLRVGLVREFLDAAEPEVAERVRRAAEALRDAGHVVDDVSIPESGDGLATYYLINYAELASAMQRFDGTRYGPRAASEEDARAAFGPEVKRRILLGTYVTSREGRGRWHERALRSRARIQRAFARAFGAHDVLVGPTMPFRAFRLGERIADPRSVYAADVLTVTANLAGTPAGTVPLRGAGLPVGLQVIGPAAHDLRVLRAMEDVERLAGVRAG